MCALRHRHALRDGRRLASTELGDDADRQAELAEEEERKAIRRGKFYKNDPKVKNTKRRHHVYRFTEADIDNENIISMVEQTPTYKRSSAVLQKIRNKTDDTGVISPEPPSEPEQPQIINFQ